MKLSTLIPLAIAVLAAPIASQSASALKKQLKKMESSAKKDPEALFEAGKWAKDANLDKEAKRIFQKVLKVSKDHVGANTEVGNELVGDKWWPAKVAKKKRAKALQAEYSAKGYKKIDDIWVSPEDVSDARKGIFKHEGELVTRDEKEQLQAGKVRHPMTGQLIAKINLEKAKNGYFPLRSPDWGDQKEANKYHSELGRPWFIRTEQAQIISTLPIEKIEKLKMHVEQGLEKVAPLFGGRQVSPAKRPLVIISKTQAEFREYATQLGDGTDVAGAFLIREDAEFRIRGQEDVRPAICENHKDWGERYIRHAAAIAYVNAIAEEGGADLPLWFVHGVGSYTSRFENDSDAGWFGKQHVAKGGVSPIKSFISGFTLDGSMEPPKIAFNLYQAGLLLSYATQGGNREVTDAMVTVTDALSGKGKIGAAKAITQLEELLAEQQDAIVAHMKKLIAKAP